MTQEQRTPFESWAIVEVMGHRRLAGLVNEQQIAGAMFIRLDIPNGDGSMVTQFYRPASIYCLTPTTEEIARAVARQSRPQVVHPWELRERVAAIPASTPTDHEAELDEQAGHLDQDDPPM